MDTWEWLFVVAWPIIVVFLYSFIVDGALKERAAIISKHFNMTGEVLKGVLSSIQNIEELVEQQEKRILLLSDNTKK